MALGEGGLKKVRPEIQIHFNSDKEEVKREYEDKFTKELPTFEDVKKKYGAVVWCKYIDCKYNQEIKGLQRTSGTLLKSRTWKPIVEQEAIWPAICTRDEIAIKFDETYMKGSSTTKDNKLKEAFKSVAKNVAMTPFITPISGVVTGLKTAYDIYKKNKK